MSFVEAALALVGELEWAVSNIGTFKAILADARGAIDSAVSHPLVIPTDATVFQEIQLIIAWGESNVAAFAKLAADIQSLVSLHKAGAPPKS